MVKRKYCVVILTLTVLWILKWAWQTYDERQGFTLAKICATLSFCSEWVGAPPSPKVQKILSETFTFLGEGAQAYAFESKDQKYVLKLFKMRRFTPSLTDYLCPHLVKRRLKNLRWVFNGYKIAYDQFQNDTGLVYIHFNQTTDLQKKLCLVDNKKISHFVDLDQAYFVVQEKAELIFLRFQRLYEARDDKGLEEAITSVLELIKRRVDQGYADRDKAVTNNYGFVGNRPIHLDVGRLYRGEKRGQVEHLSRRIDRWKQSNSSSQCETSSG